MKIIKTYEFRAFIVTLTTLTLGLALCYGLKKFEVYSVKLAQKYNARVK